jgi:peptide chain release factor subunit 3
MMIIHFCFLRWVPASTPTFLQVLDNAKTPDRCPNAPVRMPILDCFRDMGVMATGKIEQGTLKPGMQCILMPGKINVEVSSVFIEEDEVLYAMPGENVRLKLKGVEEDQVHKGSVLCSSSSPCRVVSDIGAQLFIVELLEHRPILTAGYSCVFHCHTIVEECVIAKLAEVVDRVSG